jgi:hypothetical protein
MNFKIVGVRIAWRVVRERGLGPYGRARHVHSLRDLSFVISERHRGVLPHIECALRRIRRGSMTTIQVPSHELQIEKLNLPVELL